MRERVLVHVGGPPGAGKTTLVEALLDVAEPPVLAARCVRHDSLPQARETVPNGHGELQRYRHARASRVALFEFPASEIGTDAFFMTALMANYSRSAILEGDDPLAFADLSVFVAPPPAPGERLFVRGTREGVTEPHSQVPSLDRLLEHPGIADLLGKMAGVSPAEIVRRNPEVIATLRASLFAAFDETRRGRRQKQIAKPLECWMIADRYVGIERAQLVVVNVRNEDERRVGEQLVIDLARLRKDDDLFNDILRSRGRRTPITAIVANLADQNDPQRKKVLARARRALRSRSI